jgi:hypothetical protein
MKTWTNDELIYAVSTSISMRQTLEKLNFPALGCYYTFFKKKISQMGIDTTHWIKSKPQNYIKKKPLEEILNYSDASVVRRRILQDKIFDYKCSICSINEWQDKKLTLQLDHIDGNNKNHSLENLRLLCPNCHSQTDTYTGRNAKRSRKVNKCGCGKEILIKSNSCIKCFKGRGGGNKNQKTKINWPPIEILLERLKTTPYTTLGKELGVSDNAIRKRIKNHSNI